MYKLAKFRKDLKIKQEQRPKPRGPLKCLVCNGTGYKKHYIFGSERYCNVCLGTGFLEVTSWGWVVDPIHKLQVPEIAYCKTEYEKIIFLDQ